MKQGQFISEETLLKQIIHILMENLGPVETNRFLSLPAKKRIESVKRHRIWQSKLDKNKFFNDVFH
ncbi:MAG: hypothetical protein Q6358_10190 [Candidatus Brocadiales bacterium]|uniref:hypothetical protein n=1 Tax=Candidatus Wunengus sp. YC60 TaxID=3367697 RepID=UPI002714251B|nr:hypothetical protein [Candidatus Brocadiales bacterium]